MPKFLRNFHLIDILMVGFLCLITFLYFQGVAEVPFHPDESTYIFMSADWEAYISHPLSLAFQESDKSIRQRYRLIDPPLGRYLVGISRSLAGFSAVNVDWDWSLTWDENNKAGALPSQNLLNAARYGPAALFPFSLLLMYLTGWRLGGRFLGWTAMLFLATNALVLLHTRRAMSESGLVFAICLFFAFLAFNRSHPWLNAVPLALMACAKHSTLPLVLIGFLAIFLYTKKSHLFKQITGFLATFLAIFVLLNPFLWSNPLEALQAAVRDRQDLLVRQTYEFSLAQPDAVLNAPWKSTLSLVANLFITPPAIADVGNYLAETNVSAQIYLSDPVNRLFRDIYLGGLLLALSILGWYLSIVNSIKNRPNQGHVWLLLNTAGLVQLVTLLFVVTLPFQRYVLPLVPFTCLWIGYCLLLLKEKAAQIITGQAPAAFD